MSQLSQRQLGVFVLGLHNAVQTYVYATMVSDNYLLGYKFDPNFNFAALSAPISSSFVTSVGNKDTNRVPR